MRFTLERVSEPDIEPITAAEFVRNVGEFPAAATSRADDISRLIAGAREWAEHYTGRALIDQTWRLTITDGVGALYDPVQKPPPVGYYTGQTGPRVGEILLMRSPVLAITSFVTVDASGDETAVDAATYELREQDSKWPRLVGLDGTTWGTGTFRIVFRAGYANRVASPQEDAGVVPERFKQAILLHAEAHYDRDEKMMEKLLEAAENLIAPERCHFGLG